MKIPKNKPKPVVNEQEAQSEMVETAAPMALSRNREGAAMAVAADAALEQDVSVSKSKADTGKQHEDVT